MACYFPLQAFRARTLTKSGKRGITFDALQSFGMESCKIQLPCGQCIGCRLERSRQWAIRQVHEASLHKYNSFITLTFNEESLRKYCPNGSLDVKLFQDFMKRLRKYFDKHFDAKVRFFHCGEYGEKFGRPHYHACLFGIDFPDKYVWKVVNGISLYRSPILESLWTFGHSSVGAVTFESAAYVARYILKKVNGNLAPLHYQYDFDCDTGEILTRRPEYTTMSRRPGIGKHWFDKYKSDVYPHDFVVLRNRKMKPPKYYDGLYEICDDSRIESVKLKRRKDAKKFSADQTPERLSVREICQREKLTRLVRPLDKEL